MAHYYEVLSNKFHLNSEFYNNTELSINIYINHKTNAGEHKKKTKTSSNRHGNQNQKYYTNRKKLAISCL